MTLYYVNWELVELKSQSTECRGTLTIDRDVTTVKSAKIFIDDCMSSAWGLVAGASPSHCDKVKYYIVVQPNKL